MFSSIFITSFIALVQSEASILGHWHWFNMGYIGIRNMVLRPSLYTTYPLGKGHPPYMSSLALLKWWPYKRETTVIQWKCTMGLGRLDAWLVNVFICKDLYNFTIASSFIFMHAGGLKKTRNFWKNDCNRHESQRDLNVLLLYYPVILFLIPGIVCDPKNWSTFLHFFNCYFCVPYITTFCQVCVNQQERPNVHPSVQQMFPACA